MFSRALPMVLLLLLMNACGSNTLRIDVEFEELSGLNKQDRVMFENNVAGTVESIQYNQNGTYTVRLQVDKGFSNAVTEYSQFVVAPDPRREGGKVVEIKLQRTGGRPLVDGAAVKGINSPQDFTARIQRDLKAGAEFLKQKMDKLTGDLEKIPESEEYRRLKDSLADLADELGRAEKEARQQVKEKWIPRIERELEELKRKLHESGREREAEPLQRELDRIRRI